MASECFPVNFHVNTCRSRDIIRDANGASEARRFERRTAIQRSRRDAGATKGGGVDIVEGNQKDVARAGGAQEGQATVTSESDEVEVGGAIASFEIG